MEIVNYKKVVNLNDYDAKDLQNLLQDILNLLKALQCENDFIRLFSTFRDVRVSSLLLLKNTANELDKHHLNCNISKVVGASVSAAGGVAAVIGIGLAAAATGGIAIPAAAIAAGPAVCATGGAFAMLGGANVLGTYVTERFIEKERLKIIKSTLQNDEESSQNLFQWIQRRDEVEEAIEKIMNYSVFEEIIKNFAGQFFINYKTKQDSLCISCEIPVEMKNFVNDLPITFDEKQRVEHLLAEIFINSECRNLFAAIATLYQTYFSSFHTIMRSLTVALRTFRLLDGIVDVGNGALATVRNMPRMAKVLGAIGFLSAVSIAIDIFTLVETGIDLSKGSKSGLAIKIRDCAEKMDDELKVLNSVYLENNKA